VSIGPTSFGKRLITPPHGPNAGIDVRAAASSKPRVLIVFSSGEIGGAERSLTRMAIASHGTGADYTLATIGAGAAWKQWAHEQGLSAEAFPVFGTKGVDARAIADFVAACRRLRPDVYYVVGLRAALLVRLLKLILPRALIVHGIRSSFPHGTAIARRFFWSERLLGWLTDHYIANSQVGAATLMQLVGTPPSKISVILNGVQASIEPQDDISRRGMRVVVVANLNQYKNHADFLDVVVAVRKSVPDLEVIFVGRDDSHGQVSRLIEQRDLTEVVRLTGFIDAPEALVKTARVFALTSRVIEGCPTAVLEALMIGVPVVAYAIGGLPEIIHTGRTGFLVRTPAEFADALIRLLEDDALVSSYSAAARQDAAQRFSLSECSMRHYNLLKCLVDGAQRE
jgi:glycosyltransferase involved in cell wall biosynthesis